MYFYILKGLMIVGIKPKHLFYTAIGVGVVVILTAVMTYITLWGAAGALPEF